MVSSVHNFIPFTLIATLNTSSTKQNKKRTKGFVPKIINDVTSDSQNSY